MHDCEYAEYNDGHVDCGTEYMPLGETENLTCLCQLCRKDEEITTLRTQLDALRGAAKTAVEEKGCSDPDCCEAAIDREAARLALAALLTPTEPKVPGGEGN